MSRNYLNSQAFRDFDASFDGRRWTAPPNTHPNPLSGHSEDYPDPEDLEAELEARASLEAHP